MRIQFTDDNNTYTIETIKSFAKYLAGRFEITKKPGQTEFIADFALTPYDDDCEVTISSCLDDMRETGWYGAKELGEIGFDNDNRQFVFEYYGGERMRIFDYAEGYTSKDEAEKAIEEILVDIFGVDSEVALLLIQWNEDKCLVEDREEAKHRNQIQQYEVVEVCPECGAENVITWDVEKEGYVAYCPHCGSKMMLCDECIHSDNAPTCDWKPHNGCCREREKCKKETI